MKIKAKYKGKTVEATSKVGLRVALGLTGTQWHEEKTKGELILFTYEKPILLDNMVEPTCKHPTETTKNVLVTYRTGEQVSFDTRAEAEKFLGVSRQALQLKIKKASYQTIPNYIVQEVLESLPCAYCVAKAKWEESSFEGEIWKHYKSNLWVSNFGRVRRKSGNRFRDVNFTTNRVDYPRVNIQGQPTSYLHRIIAEVFIENPLNKPCVNHKDFNKNNNNVSNLEWVDYEENAQHAAEGGKFSSRVSDRESYLMSQLHDLGVAKGKICGAFNTTRNTVERHINKQNIG